MSSPSTANLRTLCLTVVALAALALMAYNLSPIRECMKAVPGSSKLSVQAPAASSAAPGVSLSAESNSSGVQSEVQGRTVIQCLGMMLGQTVDDPNEASGDPTTLGDLELHWNKSPGGLKLTLAAGQPVLQNLDFPRYKARKAQLISDWCKANAACVRCRPMPAADGDVVTVSLAGSAPVRTPMGFNWGAWTAVDPPRPYEDIASGVRYSYVCPT